MIDRYRLLSTSNQRLVWILIVIAALWPLVHMGTPDTKIRMFLNGIAFAGSIIALVYFGEQADEKPKRGL